MKTISKFTTALLTILLLGHDVLSRSVSIVGDIRIETQNGIINCDSMICPQGASSCQVTKRNDPNDFSQLVRNRKCFASNEDIIAEETTYEPNRSQGKVNINVASGGSSIVQRQLTKEEQERLEETLNKQEKRIKDVFRPFEDGTFERNLKTKINQSLKNAFKF